jgi:GTP pyrophosphokinase
MGMSQSSYLAPIVITARDRQGLLRDIASVTSELGINVISVNTPFRSGEQAVITATLEINDLDQLQRAFARIERIKDVYQVARDLGKRK